MLSPFNYQEMARECMKEAEKTKDVARQKTLRDMAKLYLQTAHLMEGAGSQDDEPDSKRKSS